MKTSKVDPVVDAVRKDLLDRSALGLSKYGCGLDRQDLSTKEFIQHAYEEALDLANYLKRVLMDMETPQMFTRPTLTVDQLLNRDDYDDYTPDTQF